MKDYCNNPLTCDDFRRTQREIVGTVRIPINATRVIIPEKCSQAEYRGDGDTCWWQVS